MICPLDFNLILTLHDSLRKNDLGSFLLYGNVAIFRELTHERAGAKRNYCIITKGVMILLHRPSAVRALGPTE
jgi:hypothetical protein